ncbi:MAG: AAA family ATPase [Chitinophagales bacterium]|nr:AAA family ATPase [Chitinophagales bacterium]
MQLRKSQKQFTKIRMALQAPSGGGKTMSALLIAYGLSNDWEKVAIIDTEAGSADLYSSLGKYNVLPLDNPYSPENYIKAIDLCEDAGMEVIIIDSISHLWEYLLDYHSNMAGNSFTNWAKINPMLKSFVDKILSSKCHVICTLRVKQDYVLNLKDGKHIPEKVGLKSNFRDGFDFEMTIVLDIDIKNMATSSKDRTNLFSSKPAFKLTPDTGKLIKEWCESGITIEEIQKEIQATKNVDELNEIYKRYSYLYTHLQADFVTRKAELNSSNKAVIANELLNPQNFSNNGTTTL